MLSYNIASNYKHKRGTSRGYAEKYLFNNHWFKISAGAFNSHAEVVASRLTKYTNLHSVKYNICRVNREYASVSKDFTNDCHFETVGSLHFKRTGRLIKDIFDSIKGLSLLRYVRVLFELFAKQGLFLKYCICIRNITVNSIITIMGN